MYRKNVLQDWTGTTGHLETSWAPHLIGGQAWRGQIYLLVLTLQLL